MNKDITVCFVLYKAKLDSVEWFEYLKKSNINVIVYNNGVEDCVIERLRKIEVGVIGGGQNLGIAKAFNDLIGHVFDSLGQEVTIIFDQDSKPKKEMIIELLRTSREKLSNGHPVILGPVLGARSLTQFYSSYNTALELVEAPSIASSGTVIERSIWEKVGRFDENLFIDFVDHEWCFRASSLGIQSYVLTNVVMHHEMGDDNFTYFNVNKPIHRSPIRHYYIVRNYFLLLQRPYFPQRWKLKEFFKTIRRIIFYLLVSNNRMLSLKLMCAAINHGMRNLSGPLQHNDDNTIKVR